MGEESPRYHEEIGAYAHQRADVIIGIGELAKYYRPHHWFANSAECADKLQEFNFRNDCVLVKGANSLHLNTIVERLIEASKHEPGGDAGESIP